MPINEDFCHGDKKPIGKIIDGPSGNFHWVWPSQVGEGANEWDASKNEQVLADMKNTAKKWKNLESLVLWWQMIGMFVLQTVLV